MKSIQTSFTAFIIFCFALSGVSPSFSFALEENTERTFLVSAYYSPLPDQAVYVFGTYELDKRMNGEGVAGADGTPVYVGMIAAPKTYPFGTKIEVPGLGIGAVHDRGGAIIASKNIDRLDIWMGYGDEGRKRAMNWGMRTVVGKILPKDTAETLTLGKKITIPVVIATKAEKKEEKKETKKSEIPSSQKPTLSEGSEGQGVTNLQQFLYDRGFMEEKPSGYFGEKTKAGVLSFQLFYRIIPDENTSGAGIFGPKTRAKLEAVWNEEYDLKALPTIPETVDLAFATTLEKGSNGDEVKKLQKALQGLGYFTQSPNGVFGPATQEALMSFQKDHKLIGDETSTGAGKLGPKTGKKLSEVLKNKQIKIIAQEATVNN